MVGVSYNYIGLVGLIRILVVGVANMVVMVTLYYRSVEEVGALKRKLEKHKSREWMTAGDEVLLEEIKMYKVRMDGEGG